ncbi:unnamed protein product [Candidula unifasciata]|uniref:Uncharacterized protein n=1 Tax=Candidula unifasciata TaxID=100452 RepID=A0A8S3Z8V5_9EUPU|nr:unnamed protein product [Candidula unifasciata]
MDVAEDTERESSTIKTDDIALINCIESTGDNEVLKLLSHRQTFSQDDLDTSLMSACHHGYKFLVYELVRLGADVMTRDRNGNTPLLICAEKGFTNMAKFFIRGQAEINATNNRGDSALILATGRLGSVGMVKLLLAQAGIDVNHQNKEGYTALMKAVEAMDVDVIKLLLDSQKNAVYGKMKNCRSETVQDIANRLGLGKVVKLLAEYGHEPVMEAVRLCDVDSFSILINCQFYDSPELRMTVNDTFQEIFKKHKFGNESFSVSEEKIIQRLLELGAKVSDRYYSLDPVLVAARTGSYKVLQLLLEHVATVNQPVFKTKHEDLFRVAAENGRTDLIQLLLKYSDVSKLHYSHLVCALTNGHTDCARFLLRQGVKVDMKTALNSAIVSQHPVNVKFLIENFQAEVKQFSQTKDMDNLLVSASKYGNLEIIGMLLDAGANINCLSDDKKTPLMESKNAEVIYYLVKRGAIVNRYSSAKRDFSSPLTYILSQNSGYCGSDTKETIVEALLKSGARVNGKSCGGRTPLMIAISKRESRNIVQMLLNYGADYNVRDIKGNTIPLLAVQANKLENIICLLQFSKYSKDILNTQNYDGLTAVIVASKNCNLEAVKCLVDHGADVNIQDMSGNTALLHALTNVGDEDGQILTTLISAGSNVNHQNSAGVSPLMSAVEKCKPNVVKLLINLGADVNSVSKKTLRHRTAISFLPNTSYLSKMTLDCMNLLDQGARASYLSPSILHKLILQDSIHFIPQLIQCGLGPSEVPSSDITCYSVVAYNPDIMPLVSPLCLALMTRKVSLARYFIANLFMTKSDTCILASSQALRQHLWNTECLSLLDGLSAQPMSLFTLVFVSVQTAVGSGPGREGRISMLPLPQLMKDRLLFKKEAVPLDVTSTGNSNCL